MLRWLLIRSIHPPLRNAPENTFTFICPSIISPDLSFPYIHNFITYSQGIFTRKNLKPTSLKKREIYPWSCLFAFEIDGKGKFTMDKWLLPRFSSPRRERDPSFQCEKITECSNLREKYFTKNPPRKKTIHFKWKYFLSKSFTLICQLSGVLNRSLNVLKQGRVEITHNWIMNKRTINCIGYHLLQLTAYITFLPLYSYIALFQTHFFHLLAAGFFCSLSC